MALLESEYYDAEALRNPEVVYGAIKGAIEPLGDPYTSFVTPQHATVQQEDLSGKFEGIGAVVEVRDNRLLIVAPEPGRPAERAGLLPGDHITHVDGVSTEGMSVVDAVARIRGPRGTSVRLTIKREGVPDPFDVTLVREEIKLRYVRWEMLPERIAYLRLTTFGQVTADFVAALRQIREREPLGLVLDLRNNPGGYLDAAVDVASQFLDGGVVAYQEGRNGEREVHEVKRGGLLKDTPMAVLVNKGSASASEIVAGALQDHGRATLVGETTFGKGSVQRIHTLSDKSSLRITVSRWFTPNGKDLHKKGLDPDIFVASPETPPASHGEDVQLQRAVQHLLLLRAQGAPGDAAAAVVPVG
jgi:carboxyl-terminal processing protease